jgi:acyl-CoA reductase-like NAD-dependent aldehyde dehydrogenase
LRKLSAESWQNPSLGEFDSDIQLAISIKSGHRRGQRAARTVKSGYVWINAAFGSLFGTPFGGTRNSGIGNEEGLEERLSYTENKTIHVMPA